jgi:hypothetical protein
MNAAEAKDGMEKFDAVLRKVLSVPREELKRREEEWKRERARKKRAKTSPALQPQRIS